MAFTEGFGAFSFKGDHKHRVAVRQGHHEESNLLQSTLDPGQRVAEVHLGFTRGMLQRHEDLLGPLANTPNGLLDCCIPSSESLFFLKPLPNSLGCMSLLPRDLFIGLKDLLNPLLKRSNRGTFSGFVLAVSRRLAVVQNLLQRPPMHSCLPENRSLAFPVNKNSLPYFSPFFHIGMHAPF